MNHHAYWAHNRLPPISLHSKGPVINYRKRGATKREGGGKSSFNPTKVCVLEEGGGQKQFSHVLKGGHERF